MHQYSATKLISFFPSPGRCAPANGRRLTYPQRLLSSARIAILGVFTGLLVLSLSGDPVTASVNIPVFGSTAKQYKSLKPFPKWTGALQKYLKEKQIAITSCNKNKFNKCSYKIWGELVNSLRGRSEKYQLNKINSFMNRYRYIIDPINWGVKDYWESPGEFFRKFGDCEDYAITKYLTLRALGWPVEKLRIVVLQDLNLRIAHAVLLVEYQGKYKLLDNQIALIVDSERIRHYRPIYSLNENAWWRHKVSR